MGRYQIECSGCGALIEFESKAARGEQVWIECDKCGQMRGCTLRGKRTGRAIRAKTAALTDEIFDVFFDMRPQTVRQIFYACAVRGAVPKDKNGYRRVCNQLSVLRERGTLPYGWIADNTRWQIKPTTYTGINAAMEVWHDAYRRDRWQSQGKHVEIWVEKDALAGVIAPVTRPFAVPLFVARGYASKTFVHNAAQAIAQIDKPTYIYQFGDFDPSGVDAAEALQRELAKHGADFHFERVAVTAAQVDTYNLPTLPVNKRDPRARRWPYGYVCELDALPARQLQGLVADCIERHIDRAAWDRIEEAERLEKWTFGRMIDDYLVLAPNSDTPKK